MKQQTIIFILLLLTTAIVKGQEPFRISLREAQDYAIEHNKTLKNARLDLQISDLKVKETISKGLPQIDASVDYTTYFGYEMEFNFDMGGDVSFTDQQIADAMTKTFNQYPGVTQTDLYKYQAGSYFSNELSASLPKSTIPMTDQSKGTIQVGQLIYNGQFWVGLQTARLGKKIAAQGLENSILDVKESVTNAYFMALVTEKSLSIFDQNINNLKTILGHTKKMFETGILEQTDVDQLSMQVVMLENTKRSIERSIRMIYNLMKFQLGLAPDAQIVLTESIDILLPKTISGDIGSKEFDIENNILFQMTETGEKISQQMVKMEKMAFAPTITGFYAYNQKFLTTGFDMTPKNIAGASMSIPVFSSGARKHKLAQAKIQLEKTQIQKSMVSDQLKMQEEQLKFDLKSALENFNSQKENVEVARRAYDNINKKFDQGMVSSLDLTQANSNYLQAESNYIQATLSLVQAQIKLEKLYNQL